MRPLSLEFQAFGPYAKYEKIDFVDLYNKGLFLICGETGSGKTMLLDAITFALYGKSSGNIRDDFSALRCTKADFDTDTFVKFIFEIDGKTYLFERRLERKRKNLSEKYSMMKKDENGDWFVLSENPKKKELDNKAVELIGLDYDQFRQVIILPQGQFEKLLTSSSEEKEKILMNIFGEDKWQRIAEYMYSQANDKKEKLAAKKSKIQSSLSEENCETLEELKMLIDSKDSEIRNLEDEYKKNDYDKVLKEQNQLLSIITRFEDLNKFKSKLEILESQKDEHAMLIEKLNVARKANEAKEILNEIDKLKSEYEKRNNQNEEAKNKQEVCNNQLLEAKKKYELHLQKKDDIEKEKEQKVKYENKKADYRILSDLDSESKVIKETITAEQKKAEKIDKEINSLKELITKKTAEYEALTNEHSDLLNKYIAGITGELASQLVDNMPCPVCGSIHHPKKAEIADGAVTKAMVEGKKSEVDNKYSELQDITSQHENKLEAHNQQKEVVNSLQTEYSQKEAQINQIKEGMIAGINSIEDLEAIIEKTDILITKYEDTKAELEKKEKEAIEAYSSASSNLVTSQNELADAKASLSDANQSLIKWLSENEYSNENEVREKILSVDSMNLLQKQISDYEANLNTTKATIADMEKALEGKVQPDKESCEAILASANESIKKYESSHGAMLSESSRLSKKYNDLNTEFDGIEEKIREAEADWAFAKKLRGDTGTGLQRYVLGIMFSSVISAANKMLELVHDGRYRLFRSDDKNIGSNKKGLELKVYDKFSDDEEGRFVNTLSGGEKFLVSLALSIGMSTIAQRGGIKIEALFIDEGFGTLDESSIIDAMNILNSIQVSNGMVGIISHVQLLQERIPTKLIIDKAKGLSHINMSIG